MPYSMKTKIYKNSTTTYPGCIGYLLLLLVTLFFTGTIWAQAPQGFNYQAVVRNGAGTILPNQHVSFRFTIHDGGLTGNTIYQETRNDTTTPAGIITVVIGAGNIASGTFNSINWAHGAKYLQVELDAAGGNNFIDMGTTQLISVPYAQYANIAGALTLGIDSAPSITGNDTIVVNPTNPYITVTSTVTPSSANVVLTNGTAVGQCIVLLGTSMGSNGVQINNGGNINIGTMGGGNVQLQKGSTLMLMWSGMQWVKMSYSSNQ